MGPAEPLAVVPLGSCGLRGRAYHDNPYGTAPIATLDKLYDRSSQLPSPDGRIDKS